MSHSLSTAEAKPLENLDEWEDFMKVRYPENESLVGTNPDKQEEQFRDYENTARPTVREFYRLNHRYQTFDFVQEKRREFLNTLVDDSDPDTDLSQLEHLLQTAEQIRKDGHPRWFILTGLIHDLGKILCLFDEPQWAVVGDTFPVGCAYSDKIVFHKFFEANPDSKNPTYQKRLGIYEENKGLDSVTMSWGHDEYLYNIAKDYLPQEALYMIRYHSFYPAHRDGAYDYLMNDTDRKMFDWVRKFNPYDLYTKSHERPNLKELRPFYDDLISEYFPPVLKW
ncbi:MAG: inositol oxygenase family protein [Verrucomicrobiota bacterium]